MFHVKHLLTHTAVLPQSLSVVNELLVKHENQLSQYADQLLWWNAKINLVSREVSRETVKEHIRHSLLITVSEIFNSAESVIDTGTGGGLPGLPLAICCPDKEFLLNDIVSKKIMAVKQMGFKVGVENITTEGKSIEDVKMPDGATVISKHAFKVGGLVGLLKGKEWKNIVFLKGEKEAEFELKDIDEPLKVNIINLDKVLKNEFYKGKAIVEITRIDNE